MTAFSFNTYKKGVALGVYFFVLVFVAVGQQIAHRQIQEDAYFRMWGEVELRSEADFSDDALVHTMLNHDGYFVKVLQIGKEDECRGEHGVWFYALLINHGWSKTGEEVAQYEKYWIFLRDAENITGYKMY